ncbi:hypothetical protein K431DRAFT_284479 [Polychaeton citri CBS 116435]|uniref:Chalcone isomerase domain-containing protein n=1 Tax=Polychaeton citri CBS 116435 TaxID=1314669 RepID=A0A9P4Q9P3_9PEZI|nr:hypothetical protein K431DRAFT_284479 [Polychaeton citri CBS 116435]
MATPTRASMRLLSPRIQPLRLYPLQCAKGQIRHSSARYSNPTPRSTGAATVASEESLFAPRAKDEYDGPPLPRARDPNITRDPRDARQARLDWEERRRYHLRKMRFAAIGMMLSVAGLGLTVYSIDLDDLEQSAAKKRAQAGEHLDSSKDAAEMFQGKEVHTIGAGEGKRIVAQSKDGEEIELVETGTSSVPHFPRTIYLPATGTPDPGQAAIAVVPSVQPNAAGNVGNRENQEDYTLVGLGIRTVSFLSIQVYVVGLYIRSQDISSLQAELIHLVNGEASTLIPSEKEELKRRLLDPNSSREVWQELLKVPGLKTVWRISPTRNTDFGHLRDGFVTGIQNRIREARAALPTPGAELEYDTEEFGQSVQDFKTILSGGKAPKGSIVLLTRDRQGVMDVYFQEKPGEDGSERAMTKLGSIGDERIGKLIWLGYLGGAKVSSEAARKGVADGCVEFAGRPVGSVETMVH